MQLIAYKFKKFGEYTFLYSLLTESCIHFRAYITWEENVPVDCKKEHELRVKLTEYTDKLIIAPSMTVLPDPFSLKDGWVTEEKGGMTLWPCLYFSDMSDYMRTKTDQDLFGKLINDYKEGKAYRLVVQILSTGADPGFLKRG